MLILNSIFVTMYLYILFRLNRHTEQFRVNRLIAKYKQALRSQKEVVLFFASIMQLLIVEILHTALTNLGVIDVTDTKVGYRIHYYLFSLRQLQFALMIWGINKSLQRTIRQYEIEHKLLEAQKTRSNKGAAVPVGHFSGQSMNLQYLDTEDADNLQGADEEELLIIQRQRQVTMRQQTLRRKTTLINQSIEIKENDELEEINLDAVIDQQEKSRFNLQRSESETSSLF